MKCKTVKKMFSKDNKTRLQAVETPQQHEIHTAAATDSTSISTGTDTSRINIGSISTDTNISTLITTGTSTCGHTDGVRIAVHRVAHPHDRELGVAACGDQRWQQRTDAVGAETDDRGRGREKAYIYIQGGKECREREREREREKERKREASEKMENIYRKYTRKITL
jgi:hypothetical protein